jgi:hypothetical protein
MRKNTHKSNEDAVFLKIIAPLLGMIAIFLVISLNSSSLLTATAQQQQYELPPQQDELQQQQQPLQPLQSSGNQSGGPSIGNQSGGPSIGNQSGGPSIGNQSGGPSIQPRTKGGGNEPPETFREAMNNSGFTNTGNDTGIASNEVTVQNQPTNDNPCSIIETRLARGEMTIEEFETLSGILEC